MSQGRPQVGRWTLMVVLAVGMVSISFGSIFVRWAEGVPALTIAFYRMMSAVVLLTPLYLIEQWRGRTDRSKVEPAPGGSRQRRWRVLAGVALALHFAFWVTSLQFTTVAVSTLLVTTSPVLVAVISYVVLGERTSTLGLVGVLLAFLGAALLVINDLTVGDWRGPVLALGGAVMIAIYWVAGRGLRRGSSLLGYIYPTYWWAALILLILAVASGARLWGFTPVIFAVLILSGVVPQCLGHTAYNWSLKYLQATMVSTLVLAEPVFASILAYWLLSESLSALTVAGGAVVATGILLVARFGHPTVDSEGSDGND